jgi:hypothetical protein
VGLIEPDDPGEPQRFSVIITFVLEGPRREATAHLYVDGIAQAIKHNKPEILDLHYYINAAGMADIQDALPGIEDPKDKEDQIGKPPQGELPPGD